MSVYDVSAEELIKKASEEIKKIEELKAPDWTAFVKTGTHRARPPVNPDWWYLRVASLMRKLYIQSPIGVSKLRIKYGGRKRRGYKPEHFYKGSGKIIRTALQQLEKVGFVTKVERKGHKGRELTPKGKSFLDKLAKSNV